jgi:hypothetical protein
MIGAGGLADETGVLDLPGHAQPRGSHDHHGRQFRRPGGGRQPAMARSHRVFDTFQTGTAHWHQIREGTVADAPAGIREVAAHLHMIITPALNVAAGQRAGAALAELPPGQRPTAVLCANDLLGRTAAQLLLDEALGEGVHQHRQVVFEPELVVRRSSQARGRG